MKRLYLSVIASAIFCSALFAQAQTQQEDQPAAVDQEVYQQTVDRGLTYLIEKGQAEDGSFSKKLSCAVTAMAATAMMEHGKPANHPAVSKAIDYVLTFVQPDGGIYNKDAFLKNYETSLSVNMLVSANENGKYDPVIENAVQFIKTIQWDGGEGHDKDSNFYGGWGYGTHKRPDGSNTQLAIDALIAAGVDPSSVEIQNALAFLSKSQNLPSEHNQTENAAKVKKGDDDWGGSIYTPANGGETKTKPERNDAGGLRSYASMTYAGLKSFLFAGLGKDDERVVAAMDWIQRHYDLDTNPGLGAQGLYYYYHVFAKALHVFGDRTITDSEGNDHNWRAELVTELASRQRDDGSWSNIEHDRWYEGDNNLVTCYALMALVYCSPEKDVVMDKGVEMKKEAEMKKDAETNGKN